jgi:AcrR family transcriptional regulator
MKNCQYTIEQGKTTRFEILEAGLRLWPDVTPSKIARVLNTNHANILYHFKDVRAAVAEYALQVADVKVLAYLIIENNPCVAKMPHRDKLDILTAVVVKTT